jgi:predicted P-loop ATPase
MFHPQCCAAVIVEASQMVLGKALPRSEVFTYSACEAYWKACRNLPLGDAIENWRRPAYGRNRVDRPRRNIFGGTTNDNKYLRDTTGNRRIWSVDLCGKGLIDLAGIARDRDQLWAEAAAIEASGEALTLPPTLWGVASIEQQARLTHDPWEDVIEHHLAMLPDKTKDGKDTVKDEYAVGINENGEREWRVASSYLLGERVLGVSVDRQTNATTKHLADVMRTLGWSSGKTIRTTKPVRGYTKPIEKIDAPKVQLIEGPNEAAPVVAEGAEKSNVVTFSKHKPWLRGL